MPIDLHGQCVSQEEAHQGFQRNDDQRGAHGNFHFDIGQDDQGGYDQEPPSGADQAGNSPDD